MSSNVIQNVDGSVFYAVSVVPVSDPSKWTLVESKVVGDGGRETLYERNDAPPDRPEHLRIGSYPGKDGKFNTSLRMEFWNKFTDDDSLVHYEPGSIVLAWTTERQPSFSASEQFVTKMFNLVTIPAGNFSSGTPDNDGFDRLTRGITDLNLANLTRT